MRSILNANPLIKLLLAELCCLLRAWLSLREPKFVAIAISIVGLYTTNNCSLDRNAPGAAGLP